MMTNSLPSFFIAGAPKCGTTYLAKVLDCHPEIFIPASKEPAFFSENPDHGNYGRGLEFYQKNFINAGSKQTIGEASTLYFYDEDSPKLIQKHIKKPKIIIVLRNPVDRVHSNYWQYVKSGFRLQSIETLLERNDALINHMINISQYHLHINRFHDIFGKESVFFLSYKDLSESSLSVANSILDFLDIKTPLEPNDLTLEKANLSGVPRSRLLARLLRQKNAIQKSKELIPAQLIPLTRKFLETLRWKNTKIRTYSELWMSTRKQLWVNLHDVPEEVSLKTNIDTTDWKNDRDASQN